MFEAYIYLLHRKIRSLKKFFFFSVKADVSNFHRTRENNKFYTKSNFRCIYLGGKNLTYDQSWKILSVVKLPYVILIMCSSDTLYLCEEFGARERISLYFRVDAKKFLKI